jgi:integrase
MDNAKVFFNAAKRRGLILINPFEHQISTTKKNRKRDFFIKLNMAKKVNDACPDAQWRLLFALWRFAGLRKMEVFSLTWDDVLWDQGNLRVYAQKTAHHEGKDVRYVPLRDIREHLDAVYAQAGSGEAKINTRFSETNSNLDKPFKSILHQARLVPWPKLFQNLRASCETAWLNDGYPAHVVAAWIGHSVKVQRDSYAQITDGHFEAFNARPSVSDEHADHPPQGRIDDYQVSKSDKSSKSGTPGGTEPVRTDENVNEFEASETVITPAKREKPRKTQGFPGFQVAVEGFEPPTRGL